MLIRSPVDQAAPHDLLIFPQAIPDGRCRRRAHSPQQLLLLMAVHGIFSGAARLGIAGSGQGGHGLSHTVRV
ncbi:MAG: hypothetical protein ACK5N0_11295 [Synechococcaceae cyanobacterium]